jgi:SAM-dependent methyltransferase
MSSENQTVEKIREYYGKVLKSNKDLKTSCCTVESLPAYLQAIAKEIPPEVSEKFYGCGSPIPFCLEGKTVLDLGCGAGRDLFILSRLVGPRGQAIGVDMTAEQLEIARRHLKAPHVRLLQGFMEDLEGLGIANNSVDAAISNCVINLSPNKHRVFSEIFRVLKPGGELYFSDVFADRRIPKELSEDPVLRGECLGGTLYIEDFRRTLLEIGCRDYRVVSRTKIDLRNPEIEKKIGMVGFYSMTIRAFKLKLEDRCEDYGQIATYLGTIPESPHAFLLDDHHPFEKGKPTPVCSNTAAMLQETRYASHFKIVGNLSTHYGLFDCGTSPRPLLRKEGETSGGGCC